MARILCVEDSVEVQILLKRTLSPIHEAITAGSLQEAREQLSRQAIDFILLDIGLPDGDGLRFCSELKANPDFASISVFILTGSNSIQEKTLGFQLGIEDFVVKPFNPIELRLRIDSRLRKIAEHKEVQDSYAVGRLNISYSSQRVSVVSASGAVNLDFSTTQFKILSFLARNLEQVKSREQIITAVWGDGLHLSDRTIDSHVSRIRKMLVESGCAIEAVPNSGYRFVVKTSDQAAA